MSASDEVYDIVVIGGGMGGLMSACILADEGFKVCLIDRNKQLGGNLQTFSRDKEIFDTGVHYIGGLEEGQNLHQIFSYLGIMKDLKIHKMDPDGFDHISFDNCDRSYRLAQGYDHFKEVLLEQFPKEGAGIDRFLNGVKDILTQFPMYYLDQQGEYNLFNTKLGIGARDFLEEHISNRTLRAMLAGNNMLYAGKGSTTPFYVMALSMNTYIESAWKCVNGGSQIAIALARKILAHGGRIIKKAIVRELACTDALVTRAILDSGEEIHGRNFISNAHPVDTMILLKDAPMNKAYRNRIMGMRDTVSVFSVYLTLKPGIWPYMNYNIYHHNSMDVWDDITDYNESDWPNAYMVSTSASNRALETGYATGLTIMVYMKFEEVEQWHNTFNTVAREHSRSAGYEAFKHAKAEKVIAKVEKRLPGIRQAIRNIYTSSPLSYRDYIGSQTGSLYGIERDYKAPWRSFISPRSRIPNLYFVGQNVVMHGLLGVAIGCILTCSEFIGKEYLVGKIKNKS